MKVDGVPRQTMWAEGRVIKSVDQRSLPHEFVVEDITTVHEMAVAIKDMHLRGAVVIGTAAAYGMALAACEAQAAAGEDVAKFMDLLQASGEKLKATRPTAVNLEHAVRDVLAGVTSGTVAERVEQSWELAKVQKGHDLDWCRRIGEHGLKIIRQMSDKKGGDKTFNILTHCNAGWLACIDFGTATAPMYAAHDAGIKLHVYVDETRPRNQGASLTAWELGQHGVPHTVIADNTGGHLMQHGMVDMVITGADRVTRGGDVCNKIGTYLKALAAKDNNVPFYVALPSSTLDLRLVDGFKIPIEQRSAREVSHVQGLHEETGKIMEVLLTPKSSPAANYAFDVTPRHLVTGLITECGVHEANEAAIVAVFGNGSEEPSAKKAKVE
mmetsp:Transcript_31775/g.71248  ORF Transcript_31775/g.71248 Transcript_31775/m.71248 type:complete len:383 (+) Transcript_31775:47-1195(+)